MTERLSDEAKRMCVMCANKIVGYPLTSPLDGRCNLFNRSISNEQNKLAQNGECRDARISGPTMKFTNLIPERYRSAEIVGRMIRLDSSDWIFEPGTFPSDMYNLEIEHGS